MAEKTERTAVVIAPDERRKNILKQLLKMKCGKCGTNVYFPKTEYDNLVKKYKEPRFLCDQCFVLEFKDCFRKDNFLGITKDDIDVITSMRK
jgi:hypothetical protein